MQLKLLFFFYGSTTSPISRCARPNQCFSTTIIKQTLNLSSHYSCTADTSVTSSQSPISSTCKVPATQIYWWAQAYQNTTMSLKSGLRRVHSAGKHVESGGDCRCKHEDLCVMNACNVWVHVLNRVSMRMDSAEEEIIGSAIMMWWWEARCGEASTRPAPSSHSHLLSLWTVTELWSHESFGWLQGVVEMSVVCLRV